MNVMRIVTIILLCLSVFGRAGAEETARQEGRFQVGDGVVVDTVTGLMWATRDNGADIDWYEAKRYCEDFSAGGYDDWRLPDIRELATLYLPEKANRDGYYLPDAVRLSACCLWSSYDTMGGALAFSYKSGKRPAAYLYDTYQLRALPVRGTRKDAAATKKEGIFSSH